MGDILRSAPRAASTVGRTPAAVGRTPRWTARPRSRHVDRVTRSVSRAPSRATVVVVVAFWVLAGIAEIATLYFDADTRSFVTWKLAVKRAGLAGFWIGVTMLALIGYRTWPVTRGDPPRPPPGAPPAAPAPRPL